MPSFATAKGHRRARRRLIVAGGVLLALCAAPVAFASPLFGGRRNPSYGSGYYRATSIVADTGPFGWATRQSNYGSGGAAIYGCRTGTLSTTPCLLADNLRNGPAFELISHGDLGGRILLTNHSGAPFTTNATGVATGLNANFLQGHQASDFITKQQQAADSAKLGGTPASGYVQKGSLMFAVVDAAGKLQANRGATATLKTAPTTYAVAFNGNISKCATTASPVGPALKDGSLGVAPDAKFPMNAVDVRAPSPLTQGFELQVVC